MAISFSCPCGTKLSAKDEFAGRRMRCPACGYEQTIPVAQPKSAVAPPPPPRAAPSPPAARPAPTGPTFQVSSVSAPMAPPPVTVPPAPRIPVAVPAPMNPPRTAVAEVVRPDVTEAATETLSAAELEQTAVVPLAKPVRSAWVDRSLEQQVASWRDEETRRRGSDPWQPAGELLSVVLVAAVLLLLCGGIFAVSFWKP